MGKNNLIIDQNDELYIFTNTNLNNEKDCINIAYNDNGNISLAPINMFFSLYDIIDYDSISNNKVLLYDETDYKWKSKYHPDLFKGADQNGTITSHLKLSNEIIKSIEKFDIGNITFDNCIIKDIKRIKLGYNCIRFDGLNISPQSFIKLNYHINEKDIIKLQVNECKYGIPYIVRTKRYIKIYNLSLKDNLIKIKLVFYTL